MTRVDHRQVAIRKEQNKACEELKQALRKGVPFEWHAGYACVHIHEMEEQIEEQKKELLRYR